MEKLGLTTLGKKGKFLKTTDELAGTCVMTLLLISQTQAQGGYVGGCYIFKTDSAQSASNKCKHYLVNS